MGDIQTLDAPWTDERIRGLLTGEVLRVYTDEKGRQYEEVKQVSTAYEQRMRAIDGWADPSLTLDSVQLETAIRTIRDPEVKSFAYLLLRRPDTKTYGYPEYAIVQIMEDLDVRTTQRPSERLLDRAVQLVRRNERGRRQLLARVRANKGIADTPVCWRCLKVEVERIGQDCGETCPSLLEAGKPGPARLEVEDMTLEQLVDTQEEPVTPNGYGWNRIIPGGHQHERRVIPGGRNPLELRTDE